MLRNALPTCWCVSVDCETDGRRDNYRPIIIKCEAVADPDLLARWGELKGHKVYVNDHLRIKSQTIAIGRDRQMDRFIQ